MKMIVLAGALLLIMLGVLFAVHVLRAHDSELHLLAVSLFLVFQGVMTLMILRR